MILEKVIVVAKDRHILSGVIGNKKMLKFILHEHGFAIGHALF